MIAILYYFISLINLKYFNNLNKTTSQELNIWLTSIYQFNGMYYVNYTLLSITKYICNKT